MKLLHLLCCTVEIISRVAFESSDFFFEICVGNTDAFKYRGAGPRSARFSGIANTNFKDLKDTRFECDTNYDLQLRSKVFVF